MKIKSISSLLLLMLFSGIEMRLSEQVMAKNLSITDTEINTLGKNAIRKTPDNSRLAETFYPPISETQSFKVLGQGQARVPADTAHFEFSFSGKSSEEPSSPSSTQESSATLFNLQSKKAPSSIPNPQTKPKPKEKDTFKPIIDALVNIGIPANSIKVKPRRSRGNSLPFPFPSSDDVGGKLLVKIEKPTRDRLQQVVKLVSDVATQKSQLVVQSVNVQYAVNDCQPLVKLAYQEAIKNARLRADAMAEVIGVKLNNVPSISESFFYDLFVPLCSEEANLPSFLPFGSISSPYDPEAAVEVQLRRDIFVTYPIK